jgi:CRISPR type I-E-associated protein CasB/Cse2
MNTDNPEHNEVAVVSFVSSLKKRDDGASRGTLALLRGALSDSEEKQIRAWRVLARFGGIPHQDPHNAEVVRTVAGLLAMPKLRHSPSKKPFGHACLGLLADDERKSLHKTEQPGPIARRMQHLLAASRSEICERVRQLGRRLDKEERSLDFAQLNDDLRHWGDRVKARWALAFWGVEADGAETNAEREAAE